MCKVTSSTDRAPATQASTVSVRLAKRRRQWLTAHRWFALTAGWVLAFMGLTGALLVITAPVDEQLNGTLLRIAPDHRTAPVSLESVRRTLSSALGQPAALSFVSPREPDRSLAVTVRGKWTGVIYIDPYTGRELGRRARGSGFFQTLFHLHSSLALDSAGKPLLAGIALCYLVMLATGLILWWPRSGPVRWRIEWRKGTTRALYDLHRATGAALGLVIAVSVATGAYMAWRPLGGFVTALAGAKPVRVPTRTHARAKDHQAATLPLDDLVAAAQAKFPDGKVFLVQVPMNADAPVRVRLHVPDDPHPNGLTSVWLDPANGAILEARRWNQLDPGARAVAIIYPLHTGQLGGPLLQGVMALNGLTLFGLSVSGVCLWWRRKYGAQTRRRS